MESGFAADPQPKRLLVRHAALVDRIVRGLWLEVGAPPGAALVAVGGYGRGELFPHSDIDVLILLPRSLEAGTGTAAIERFIGMLWDAGLEVAHSVRTIEECETEMAHDITIRTSLLEQRLLAGSRSLYDRFCRRFAARIDVRAFFEAKASRAAAAPSAPPGYGVQPRAQRQGKSGRLARFADDHLDRTRRGIGTFLARACHARLDDRVGSARGHAA